MENEKIGCALITCDRPDFYKKSLNSLLDAAQDKNIEYVVINDGLDKLPLYPVNFIETGGKKGVAVAKNLGLKFLIDTGCTHLFLMEDDIEIVDNNVFSEYIKTSKKTGIKHLNFGLHGNHNRDSFGNPTIIKSINYGNNTIIDLYPNILGAFSYYHKSVIEKIGFIDEEYYLSMEHVDHTYKASLNNYTSPWRYFADIHRSHEYLIDIVPDHQQSKIRNESNFQEIFKKGLDLFIKKNGFSVVQGYGPKENFVDEKTCREKLKEIYHMTNILPTAESTKLSTQA
jgi:GT2 family glycosyltransferase